MFRQTILKNTDWFHYIVIWAHYSRALDAKWHWFSFEMHDTWLIEAWQAFKNTTYSFKSPVSFLVRMRCWTEKKKVKRAWCEAWRGKWVCHVSSSAAFVSLISYKPWKLWRYLVSFWITSYGWQSRYYKCNPNKAVNLWRIISCSLTFMRHHKTCGYSNSPMLVFTPNSPLYANSL